MKSKTFTFGFLSGLGVVIYCASVALLMTFLENKLSEMGGGTFPIIIMLILLVFSAAISGSLVFGYPAYLFIKKEFRSAIYTLATSLVTIIFFGVLALIIMILYY